MDIVFSSSKFQKECNTQKLLEKRHGVQRATLIERRLKTLSSADCLEDIRNLAGRCHELRADRAGQLSLDLDGPYRLLFKPAHDPPPKKPDGGLDWRRVTAVIVIEVRDTHG